MGGKVEVDPREEVHPENLRRVDSKVGQKGYQKILEVDSENLELEWKEEGSPMKGGRV